MSSPKGPHKVLVVDDSVIARRQVIAALAETDLEPIEAQNGDEALLRYRTEPAIVLVVTDVNMPVMDGLELARQIRALPERNTVPIIMVTTEGTPDQIKAGQHAGVTGWLVKPFNPNHLKAAVQKARTSAAAS